MEHCVIIWHVHIMNVSTSLKHFLFLWVGNFQTLHLFFISYVINRKLWWLLFCKHYFSCLPIFQYLLWPPYSPPCLSRLQRHWRTDGILQSFLPLSSRFYLSTSTVFTQWSAIVCMAQPGIGIGDWRQVGCVSRLALQFSIQEHLLHVSVSAASLDVSPRRCGPGQLVPCFLVLMTSGGHQGLYPVILSSAFPPGRPNLDVSVWLVSVCCI